MNILQAGLQCPLTINILVKSELITTFLQFFECFVHFLYLVYHLQQKNTDGTIQSVLGARNGSYK